MGRALHMHVAPFGGYMDPLMDRTVRLALFRHVNRILTRTDARWTVWNSQVHTTSLTRPDYPLLPSFSLHALHAFLLQILHCQINQWGPEWHSLHGHVRRLLGDLMVSH